MSGGSILTVGEIFMRADNPADCNTQIIFTNVTVLTTDMSITLILIRSRRSDPSIRGRELPGGKDIDNIYDNNILPGGVLKRDYLLIFFLPGGENQHQRWRRSA